MSKETTAMNMALNKIRSLAKSAIPYDANIYAECASILTDLLPKEQKGIEDAVEFGLDKAIRNQMTSYPTSTATDYFTSKYMP